MLILGIDTTTLVGSIGLIDDEKGVLGEYTLNIKRTHSERLMPAISCLLSDVGVAIDDLDLVSVSKGPGSFTGVRIGVTTAKSLAQALGKPLVGVVSLDVLAHNLVNVQGLICPILDARKQEVYTACYQAEGTGKLEKLMDYSALGIEALLAELNKSGQRVYFLGDGVKVYSNKLQEALGSRYCEIASSFLLPRGTIVAELGLLEWKKNPGNFLSVQPFYLRKSEAELAWEKKQGETDGKCSN